MTEATAENCWRDLLVQDIRLPVLWKLITEAKTPLFRAKMSGFDVSRGAGAGAVTGYDIALRRGPALRDFERLVRNDPDYKHSRVSHTWRIWIVGKRRPVVDTPSPICAEKKYNEVAIGDETRAVLKLQEDARLVFHTRMFVADYRAALSEWKRLRREISAKFPTRTPQRNWTDEERRLRTAEVKLQAFVWEYRSVYEQAAPLRRREYPGTPHPGMVPIRSAFYKVLNRRYQPAHFWLTQISGREDHVGRETNINTRNAGVDDALAPALRAWLGGSPRARWFLAPAKLPPGVNVLQVAGGSYSSSSGALAVSLVSIDVSASQTQIQAILLGIEDMERDAVLSRRPHKELLAEHAWAAHKAEGSSATAIAERARALEMEARLYRREVKKVRPDLVENHQAALALIAAHEERVARIRRQFDSQPYGPLLVGYDNEKDPKLIEMMKNLWMVLGYGSSVLDIVREQERDPDLYGKGWRKRPTRHSLIFGGDETAPDVRAINLVPQHVPGYQKRWEFLMSCRNAVQRHLRANPYAGLRLIDPLDGTKFEWNEPLAEAVPIRLDKWDLMTMKLGFYVKAKRCPECDGSRPRRRGTRWYCRQRDCWHVWPAVFRDRGPDHDGKLYLDPEKLRKMLAPCLIHLLDSLFSSYVMQALAADGVKDFVAVHDSWFVGAIVYREGRELEPGHVVLDRAIKAAGKPWLLALGPVYQWMRQNIGGAQIDDAYRKWQARVARGLGGDETAWPHFYAVASGSAPAGSGADSPSGRRALGSGPPPALPAAR